MEPEELLVKLQMEDVDEEAAHEEADERIAELESQLRDLKEENDDLCVQLVEAEKSVAEMSRLLEAAQRNQDQAETRYVDALELARERDTEISELKRQLADKLL